MGDGVPGCGEGAVYIQNFLTDEAAECAAELTRKTGQPYTTSCTTENISDGQPVVVYATYCKVIKGQSRQ